VLAHSAVWAAPAAELRAQPACSVSVGYAVARRCQLWAAQPVEQRVAQQAASFPAAVARLALPESARQPAWQAPDARAPVFLVTTLALQDLAQSLQQVP